MPMPKIDKENLKKPLCYDPNRKRFIYFPDIESGRERIIRVETLSEADLKKLVIERQRSGPDYTVQSISGPAMSRGDVIHAIERDEPFGRVTLEAERSYLIGFLAEIQRNLPK